MPDHNCPLSFSAFVFGLKRDKNMCKVQRLKVSILQGPAPEVVCVCGVENSIVNIWNKKNQSIRNPFHHYMNKIVKRRFLSLSMIKNEISLLSVIFWKSTVYTTMNISCISKHILSLSLKRNLLCPDIWSFYMKERGLSKFDSVPKNLYCTSNRML